MQADRFIGDLCRFVIHSNKRIGVIHVSISPDNINISITGIPAAVDIAAITEIPDQIVKPPYISIAVVHKFPEFFEVFGSAFAPPEPLTVKFVERTPDNRYTCFFQFQKCFSTLVHTCDEFIVLICSRSQCLVPIKVIC